MYRGMLRKALRLALLVTLVVLAVSSCGGDNQQQASEPQPLPEVEQELRPGEYRSKKFESPLSFTVGKGWSTSPPEVSDALLIRQGETKGLSFINPQEVYKPTRTGSIDVAEAPKNIVDWYRQHPYLQTDKPEPVTVGGVEGEQFDVVVEDLPEDYYGVCGMDCVGLFRLSSGSPLGGIMGKDKVRVTVLEDVQGDTVVIVISSLATEFGEFAPKAQKVLDSVEWRGS